MKKDVITDHLADVGKMVDVGGSSRRDIPSSGLST